MMTASNKRIEPDADDIVEDARYVSRLTRNTLALILAGGQGSRLHELTTWRAKPALYTSRTNAGTHAS